MTTMLKNRLKDMKLAGIANSIDERIEYANKAPCGRRPKNVDLDFRVVVEHQFACKVVN